MGWDIAASVGGSLTSTAANMIMNNHNNQKNADMAKAQMKFQDKMSSTAHQREVKDLIAAGLNPMLSANSGGASTPAGAAANQQAGHVGDLGNMISSARAMSASTANTKADTDVKKAEVPLKAASTAAQNEQINLLKEQTDNAKYQGQILKDQSRKQKIDSDFYERNSDWLPAANAITPLVGQGIGAATNALSLGSIVKGLFGGKQQPMQIFNETRENYNSQGEHIGTQTIRRNR